MGFRVGFLAGGHSDFFDVANIKLQLRDSAGFAPGFPRFLWWLLPTKTGLCFMSLSHCGCFGKGVSFLTADARR